MKLYVHKHLKFELDFWEMVEDYMRAHNLDNFTELIRTSLITRIKQD